MGIGRTTHAPYAHARPAPAPWGVIALSAIGSDGPVDAPAPADDAPVSSARQGGRRVTPPRPDATTGTAPADETPRDPRGVFFVSRRRGPGERRSSAEMSGRHYLTTSIPYVNAAPHLGHALEFVQADVFARYHRLLGDDTRLQSGTDDNSLKNVLAAERAGVPVRELVDGYATVFRELRMPWACSTTTSSAPRRTPATCSGCAGCGRPSTAGGTSTSATTRGSTASAASSSTPRTSWWRGAALTTARSRRRSGRRTTSSASPATRSPSNACWPPAGCASSPRRGATRCWPWWPGAAGLQHLPQPGAGPGVGDRGPRRPPSR